MAGKKYSTDFKTLIIKEYKKGVSQLEIGRKFALPKSTVSFIINKFKACGTVETLQRGGRPRCTTSREDAKIIREFKKYPEKSASSVVNTFNLRISGRTVQRRACQAGLKSYRAAKKTIYIGKKP